MKRESQPFRAAEGVPAWWKPLHARCPAASVFLGEAWMAAWIATFGAEFEGEWLCWREESGEVVAGVLVLERRLRRAGVPLRALFLNASGEASVRTPLLEYNDLLCLPECREAVMRDFSRWLSARAWHQVHLSGVESGGALDRLGEVLPALRLDRRTEEAPYVPLAALPEGGAMKLLSGNSRGQVSRSRRLYEETRGVLALDAAPDRATALAWLESLARLHNARWQERGESGAFTPEALRFHRHVIDAAWDEGTVHVLRLAAGAEEIGLLYCLARGGKVAFFQSGFAYEGDARLKPGLLAHALAIDHFAAAGFAEYDFMAGDSRYKRAFARESRTLAWAVAHRRGPTMRVLLWGAKLSRRLRRSPAPVAESRTT